MLAPRLSSRVTGTRVREPNGGPAQWAGVHRQSPFGHWLKTRKASGLFPCLRESEQMGDQKAGTQSTPDPCCARGLSGTRLQEPDVCPAQGAGTNRTYVMQTQAECHTDQGSEYKDQPAQGAGTQGLFGPKGLESTGRESIGQWPTSLK